METEARPFNRKAEDLIKVKKDGIRSLDSGNSRLSKNANKRIEGILKIPCEA